MRPQRSNDQGVAAKVAFPCITSPAQEETIHRALIDRFAPLKILVKVKNESAMLREWVDHHSQIVGPENLVILDNMSTSDAATQTLSALADTCCVLSFEGYHNNIHERAIFSSFYKALCASCSAYVFVDADERLVWLEKDKWQVGPQIVEAIKATQPFGMLPTAEVTNASLRSDVFHFDASDVGRKWMLAHGKPVISAIAQIPHGERAHNYQFPSYYFSREGSQNLFLLHLRRKDPEQRIHANIMKLVSRGVVSDDADLDEILQLSTQPLPYDGVSRGVFRELAEIDSFLRSPDSAAWGPQHDAASFQLFPDGNIGFDNPRMRALFAEFLVNGLEYIDEASDLWSRALARVTDRAAQQLESAAVAIRNQEICKAVFLLEDGMRRFPHVINSDGLPSFESELLTLRSSIHEVNTMKSPQT